MPNPFKNGTFKAPVREKSPAVKLAFPGDSFGIKVTKINNPYTQTSDQGDTEKFVINGELLDGSSLSEYAVKGQRELQVPPTVGETVAYFHNLTYASGDQHWHDQNFRAALTAAGVDSLVPGDELWAERDEDSGKSHVYNFVVVASGERKESKSPFKGKKA